MINAALIFRSVAGQGQGVYGEGLDDASICRLSIWKRHLSYNHLTCPLNKRLNVICGKDGYVFLPSKFSFLSFLAFGIGPLVTKEVRRNGLDHWVTSPLREFTRGVITYNLDKGSNE